MCVWLSTWLWRRQRSLGPACRCVLWHRGRGACMHTIYTRPVHANHIYMCMLITYACVMHACTRVMHTIQACMQAIYIGAMRATCTHVHAQSQKTALNQADAHRPTHIGQCMMHLVPCIGQCMHKGCPIHGAYSACQCKHIPSPPGAGMCAHVGAHAHNPHLPQVFESLNSPYPHIILAYMRTHMHMHTHTHMHACTHVHVHAHAHTCTHTCMHLPPFMPQ